MKATNSQLSTFNFQLITLVFLLFAAGCSHRNNEEQPGAAPMAATDSVPGLPEDSVSQEWNAQLDSMLRVAKTAKQDTSLAGLYYEIALLYSNANTEKAKEYYRKLRDMSEQLNWNKGRYLYASNWGYILLREGLIDSALVVVTPALELAKKENNELWIGNMTFMTAEVYNFKEWREMALQYYMEALAVFERLNDTGRRVITYKQIGQLYASLKLPGKVIEYSEKALLLKPDSPDALMMLAQGYAIDNQYERSIHYSEEALRFFTEQNNQYMVGYIYFLLGSANYSLNNFEKAETCVQKALKTTREIGDVGTYSLALMLKSRLEMLKGYYAEAEKNIKEAQQLVNKTDDLEMTRMCYIILSDLALLQGKIRENIQYEEEWSKIETKIATEANIQATAEMEAKYETEKKELKIAALEKEKQLMVWLSIAGGAALLLALATFFFLWLLTKRKKQLAEICIKQLEQEKQLVAAQAVLDGEVQERSRIARDLHDGLGSMLTGIKHSFTSMKENLVMTPDNARDFGRGIDLLNNSITEMRRVAHNLIPEILMKYGLDTALSEFCAEIDRSSKLHTIYQPIGMDGTTFDRNLSITAYRAVQELVNNTLKYAGASNLLIQAHASAEEHLLLLTVEDDGKGFDLSGLEHSKGIGWKNIRNRVELLKGKVDIDTAPGKGTSVLIEIPLP